MSEPRKAGEQNRARRLGILDALSNIIQRYEDRESAASRSSRVDDFTLNRDTQGTMRDLDHPLVSGVTNYYRARGASSHPTRPPDHSQRSREIVQRYEDRQLENVRLFGRR
jgi:hypothetical protein